jgi:hypothetical protein
MVQEYAYLKFVAALFKNEGYRASKYEYIYEICKYIEYLHIHMYKMQ